MVEKYLEDIRRAYIDAAQDPLFRSVMEQDDYETLVVDLGDGRQSQVQALARSKATHVLERVMDRVASAGGDLRQWICDKDQFDFCRKRLLPDLARSIFDFLQGKTAAVSAAIACIWFPPAGAMAIFSALGLAEDLFVRLCNCDKHADRRSRT